MAWEYEIIFKFWRFAILRTADWKVQQGDPRKLGVGWHSKYKNVHDQWTRSWRCAFVFFEAPRGKTA